MGTGIPHRLTEPLRELALKKPLVSGAELVRQNPQALAIHDHDRVDLGEALEVGEAKVVAILHLPPVIVLIEDVPQPIESFDE